MRTRQQLLIVLAVAVLMLLVLILLASRPLAPASSTMETPKPLPVQIGSSPPTRVRLPAAVRAPDMTDPSDGMAYVEASLALAQAGDHRVQYYIAKVAMRCAPLYHNYLAGEVEPEADDWTFCGSFEQPIPDGQYWLDQAVAGKDALAMLHVARDEFYAFSGERGTREALDAAIERAHESGDPEVQAMLASAMIAANLPEVP